MNFDSKRQFLPRISDDTFGQTQDRILADEANTDACVSTVTSED